MEIKLTAKMILDKDFKTGLRGYNPDEVDQFLDEIIQDYEKFEKVITQLQAENRRLKEELENAPAPKQTVQTAYSGTTNFDILKRLSNLEKHVFGDKLYE